MKKLLEDIEKIEFTTGKNFSYDLDREFKLIASNFFSYQKEIQKALLLIIGKIVKRICEYGRTNFAYMKIENEFDIELLIDNLIELKLKVQIN